MNKKYAVRKNLATGRKTYYPVVFFKVLDIPCKTAVEAITVAEQVETASKTPGAPQTVTAKGFDGDA